jgi:hypothetical protein
MALEACPFLPAFVFLPALVSQPRVLISGEGSVYKHRTGECVVGDKYNISREMWSGSIQGTPFCCSLIRVELRFCGHVLIRKLLLLCSHV